VIAAVCWTSAFVVCLFSFFLYAVMPVTNKVEYITLGLSHPVSRDIAVFLHAENDLTPPLYHPNVGCSPWTILPMLWSQERIIPVIINFELVQPMLTVPQHYKRTDRQMGRSDGSTTYDSHTALCTMCIAR